MHLCQSDCEWLNTGMEHLTSEHQNIRAKVSHIVRISLEVYIFGLRLASFSLVRVCLKATASSSLSRCLDSAFKDLRGERSSFENHPRKNNFEQLYKTACKFYRLNM